MGNLNTDMIGRAMLCMLLQRKHVQITTTELGSCIVRFYVAYYFISVLIG